MAVPNAPSWWRNLQSLRGTNSTTLTEKDVPTRDLTGKWIIVSGANNGIGLEASKTFSSWGANVILACREPPKWETHPDSAVEECKKLASSAGHSSTIEWWSIDMADLKSVESLAQKWLQTGRTLDILCNNAGAGTAPSVDMYYTKDKFEFVHQVNLLSHVLLTLMLLPSLAKSPDPRIVCTTSSQHFLGDFDIEHFNGGPGMKGEAYGNNKLYFQAWITELQERLSNHNEYRKITINGLHPGYVNTGIFVKTLTDQPDTLHAVVVRGLAPYLAITPAQGSFAIVNAATNPKYSANLEDNATPSVEVVGGGKYINRIWETSPMPHCTDKACRAQVWQELDEELALKDRGLLVELGG